MAATASSAVSEDVPWSSLPQEVVERVLSFLPVAVLCRLRTVCKGWNDLLCGPSFHDLYEQNGKRLRQVCFLTRFEVSDVYSRVDPPLRGTTCFLDLDERRWYSIERSKDRLAFDTRVVAMDEGLVAEFCCEEEVVKVYDDTPIVKSVRISDPVSKMNWSLEPPFRECPRNDELPTLVVAADRVSRSFQLFLMTNTGPYSQFLYIFDSSKDGWRRAEQPKTWWNRFPTDFGTRATSAVFFRGECYAIVSPFASDPCLLMKFDCEKDTWSMILEDLPEQPGHPQLLVSTDSLFMTFFRLSTFTGTPTARTKLSGSRGIWQVVEALEMVEIQIPENASRTVFQIPSARLEHDFGEPIDDLACVVPRVGTDGSCSSVTLVSSSSGRVIMYDVVSGSAEMLPAHPLRAATPKVQSKPPRRRRGSHMRYQATYTNLSFRDILRKQEDRSHPFFRA